MKSRKQWPGRVTLGYISILTAAFIVAMIAGLSTLAEGMEGSAYDWMFRVQPPAAVSASSVVVAFDEQALSASGGMRNLRATLAGTLRRLNRAKPAVVAIDIALPDATDRVDDLALEKALATTPNLVLGSDVLPGSDKWEDPLPRFRQHATAVGHVHAAPDPVNRKLPLEVIAGHDRRWAMALEAYRLRIGGPMIEESLHSLDVGSMSIPARRDTNRALFIRYSEGIPRISALSSSFSEVSNKVVFIGITAQTAARDRLMTPFGMMMTGVEIHAQAYETISRGRFLIPASPTLVAMVCLLLTVGSGATFALLSGWPAY